MEMYLIRHTAPAVEKGICYGQADLDVSPSFPHELFQLEKSWTDRVGVTFISSPLQRCTKLAEALSGGKFSVDRRLMEMNFGDWEMQRWNDIDRKALDKWSNDFVVERCPNGESYDDLHHRVGKFLADLKAENHQRVALVTHAGVIRSVLCHFEHTTLETSFDVDVAYGNVFRVDSSGVAKLSG